MDMMPKWPEEYARKSEKNGEVSNIGKILRSGVSEIVIHGDTYTPTERDILNEKEAKSEDVDTFIPIRKELVKTRPDLDGRAAIFLLENAGIKYNRLSFVKKGDWLPKSINIDTGEKSGLFIEKNTIGNPTVFIDHHGPERGAAHSATRLVYEILKTENLIEGSEWLENLVRFVDEVDDEDYPLDYGFYTNGWSKSFYCLHKVIPFETMVEYIKKGRSAKAPFTDEEINTVYIKTISGREKLLKDICDSQQKAVEASERIIKKVERSMTKNLLKKFEESSLKKVLVNSIEAKTDNEGRPKKVNNIPLVFSTVRAFGYDSYVMINENRGGFFITSRYTLDRVYSKVHEVFPEAKIVRGTMIVQNPTGEKIDQKRLLEILNLLE